MIAGDAAAQERKPTPPETRAQRAAATKPAPLLATPTSMDFGFLPPNTPGVGKVELRNSSDAPVTIEGVVASCKCTTINDLAGKVIEPGESVSLEIKLDGAPAMGVRRSSVKVMVAGFSRGIDIPVKGEVSLPVRTVPAYINAVDNKNLTGRFVVESIDKQPFRILSTAGAPVQVESPLAPEDGPRSSYIVSYDLKSMVGSLPPFIYFETDHPSAAVIDIRVRHERSVKAMPIRLQDPRCNLGRVAPGSSHEARFTLIDPFQQIDSATSDSKEITVELLRTEQREGRVSEIFVKVTVAPGFTGLLVAPIKLASKTAVQDVEVIASVRP